MKIDYKKHVIFPYTDYYLQQIYPQESLKLYKDQLALLLQNGFVVSTNSPQQIAEQMQLWNNLETWEDFDELLKCFQFQNNEPTVKGYKMVDSVLRIILKKTAWAKTDFINIRDIGAIYKSTICDMIDIIEKVFDCEDFEIGKVLDVVFDNEEITEVIDKCFEYIETDKPHLLLVQYQKLYKVLDEAHKKINRACIQSSEKNLTGVVSNVNDEIYGSSGYYLPQPLQIKCVNGSALFELKTLCDKSKSDKDLRIKMLVLAKEYAKNDCEEQTVVNFAKGKNVDLDIVRQDLTKLCVSGILYLLCMKHGITLIKGDSLNEKRAEKVCNELSDICNYAKCDVAKYL